MFSILCNIHVFSLAALTDFLAISISGPLALPGLSDLVGSLTYMKNNILTLRLALTQISSGGHATINLQYMQCSPQYT